jgi:L-2-hydroxyglutarate oxidase LhgO
VHEFVEAVVIGAGVVGLAVARALALSGREVLVLEAESSIGNGVSSRNSEVIHAGIYYPTGSVRAVTCVAGKHFLYRYCAERGIPHRRCGKLIVASDNRQVAVLDKLQAQACANGVHDLVMLDAPQAHALEPELACVAAVHSPSTGIIDSHALMLAFQGDAEERGAMIAFNTPVLAGALEEGRIVLETGGATPLRLACRFLVNAASLGAQAIARALRGFPGAAVPPLHYAKGNYFSLGRRAPFTRLIYPVPEPGGLGVHVTLDLAGQARFGPDVEWIDAIDYDVDARRADRFYAEIRKYWPRLNDGDLLPAYAGIRPKLTPQGASAADFVIQGPTAHGVPGLVNLFGIESPGLTASPAIADAVIAALDAL